MKAFLFICVVVVAYVLVRKYIGLFIITSNSMHPTILAGDIVVTIRRNAYRTGDIITFQTPHGQHITHRVISQSASSYLTKGDGNKRADTFIVHKEHINGAVTVIINTSIFFSKGRIR